MGTIIATKLTGPLIYAAIDKGAIIEAGITNPGELTISGIQLISDTKESVLIDKVLLVVTVKDRSKVVTALSSALGKLPVVMIDPAPAPIKQVDPVVIGK